MLARPRTDFWAIAAAVVLAAGTFLPLATCCATQRTEWLSGAAIVCGLAVVLTILARSRRVDYPVTTRAVGTAIVRSPGRTLAVTTALAFVLYVVIAVVIFERRPILIDEIAFVRQAQIFAGGHLWLRAPVHPEFTSTLQMVTANGRVYSQYPPGGPALLIPFVLAGASWLAGPFYGALAVAAFAALARAIEPDPRVAAAAVALFAFAPFVFFLSGTHMNCVPALAFILAGAAAIAHAVRRPVPCPRLTFAGGVAFGLAATIRPVDALAFAIPAAVWLAVRAAGDRARWRDVAAAGAGVALPIAAMLVVNARTTGAPLLFGYDVFWGPGHTIGFHRSPLGHAHTPADGLRFVATYILQLNRYLFETPIPSLLPAIAALALTRRVGAADRYLIASAALLVVLYAAYWHEGFFLGPRFVFALTPFVALWTARLPRAVPPAFHRPVGFALAVSAAIALTVSIPVRARQYASSFATERWAQPDVARRAGVHDALVFVHDGWDGQLIARLWALGVPPADAEQTLRRVDACRLDRTIAALERAPVDDDPVAPFLALARDSASVKSLVLGPGESVRVQPGAPYPPACLQRLADTRAGVTPLAPLLVLDDGNIYARDLGPRDTLLTQAYPTRPVWHVRRVAEAPDAPPRFEAAPIR